MYCGKGIFVVRVAQGLAPLIAVALSDERTPVCAPVDEGALGLLERCGPRVSGEPA